MIVMNVQICRPMTMAYLFGFIRLYQLHRPLSETTVCMYFEVSVISVSICPCLFLSVCLSHSPILSLCVFLSLSHSVSVSMSLTLSVSVCLCLVCLSVSLPLSLIRQAMKQRDRFKKEKNCPKFKKQRRHVKYMVRQAKKTF